MSSRSLAPEVEGYDLRNSAAAGITFFVVTGVVTGLIPNQLYVRMVSITLLDYFFLLTTCLLAAVYFGKNNCGINDNRLAAFGGVTGFLAFGCPVCNVILLVFFSSSVTMAYIDPLRPFLGLLSTVALAFLILRSRNV